MSLLFVDQAFQRLAFLFLKIFLRPMAVCIRVVPMLAQVAAVVSRYLAAPFLVLFAPAVYIMIVPIMGVVSDVLATFARKAILATSNGFCYYGYRVFGLCSVGHHMFLLRHESALGTTFMLSTIVIYRAVVHQKFSTGLVQKGNIHFTTRI